MTSLICAKKYLLTLIVIEFVMTQNTLKQIRLLYINGIREFDIDIKLAQMTQNSWNFIFQKSSLLKKWFTSVIIQEISFSDLESER